MTEQQFHVIFKGKLVKGASAEQVRNNLAKLFKAEPAKLNHLFAGNPVIIKKGLDRAGADKYETVLRRAGAIVEIVEQNQLVGKSPVEKEAIAPAKAPPASATPQAPDSLTMAEVGVTLVDHVPPPPADFDTTHLNLAELGVDLVDAEKVAAPEYDLSGLSLDPVGVDLDEKKPASPPDIDTSGLTLSDP
ncbi:MAG: hypothetical protein ACU84Q_02930 [Gammaproteobacteria bacterium]